MMNVLREPLVALLGKEAFMDGGELNRQYIATKIFSNPNLLQQINSLVHPAVKEDFLRWASTFDTPYVIIETALLLESGIDGIVDMVITVTAPLELRVERAATRDNVPRQKVLQRIKSQRSQEDLIEVCDFIIDTSEGEMIVPSVVDIDTKLREIANCKK